MDQGQSPVDHEYLQLHHCTLFSFRCQYVARCVEREFRYRGVVRHQGRDDPQAMPCRVCHRRRRTAVEGANT